MRNYSVNADKYHYQPAIPPLMVYNFTRMESPLFEALFEEEERLPVSVSELNADIRATLERSFGSVWVEGEITNFHAAASGHWYFSLTDGASLIKAACFKGQNFRIRFKPFDGLQVRVRGRVTTYEKRGEYQLLVESLEPVGEGALTVAFEQIKAKLAKEGLFDQALKRLLPPFPRRIGIVTSPTGAAVHDIISVLERRARSVSIVLVPTLVQGDQAGEQIEAAIALANEFNDAAEPEKKIDVLIVGRGGGSAEDLWAFNEERVARAIRASKIPVISAVGHEVDFSIADMVADLRAPTPSAAAEIVAKAEIEIVTQLEQGSARLARSMNMILLAARADMQSLAMAPIFAEFPARIRNMGHDVDGAMRRATESMTTMFRSRSVRTQEVLKRLSPLGLAGKLSENKRRLGLLDQRSNVAGQRMTESRHRTLEKAMSRLDAMSPLRVLERGYSITQKSDNSILRDAADAAAGELLRIRLAKGEVKAEVKESF